MTISTRTFQMHRLHPAFGVDLSGVDLRLPLDDGTWAHMWEALAPEMQRRLEGRVAVHSFAYSRGLIDPTLLGPEVQQALPPVRQALVRANPLSGRKSVYIGSHASHIEGMPVEERRALLKELLELATRPEGVHRHVWRQHDLVIWDNRCLLHRGRPWDARRYTRVMHRTTVAGDGPTA